MNGCNVGKPGAGHIQRDQLAGHPVDDVPPASRRVVVVQHIVGADGHLRVGTHVGVSQDPASDQGPCPRAHIKRAVHLAHIDRRCRIHCRADNDKQPVGVKVNVAVGKHNVSVGHGRIRLVLQHHAAAVKRHAMQVVRLGLPVPVCSAVERGSGRQTCQRPDVGHLHAGHIHPVQRAAAA